ncbi:MAG: response regulator [Anaerolineales bacterium]
MSAGQERILVVENNRANSDLIARQTLSPMGYQVQAVRTAGEAIQQTIAFAPDIIIANINLPDLSGKDLLVALSSQGLEVPVIIIAEKGEENDLVQAFRLGASDYLLHPIREAEVISAVERVLKQVRSRRERESLEKQLSQTNKELQQRVRELTTIYSIGKAVTSITDQPLLFDRIVEGAVFISAADRGWLLLRQQDKTSYILSAQLNLPAPYSGKLNQPWEDGISHLVALSGEPLSIHGEPLNRFKVSHLAQSLLVVPVKAKKEVIGLLVVARNTPRPFGPGNQALLEAVADYASISLVNARLFKALETRAHSYQESAEAAQTAAANREASIHETQQELADSLQDTLQTIQDLLVGENSRLNNTQKSLLRSTQGKLSHASKILDRLG